MSANTTSTADTAAGRPQVVDYAIYALIARCVFSVAAALALYGARDEVTRSLADANKDKHWSAETLHHNVDAGLRSNLISSLVVIVMVAIIIRFIWEGRNWARLLYVAFAVLVTRDLFAVLGFFQYHDFLTRTLTGLVGLSSIAAVVLLFLPPANPYFRRAGSGRGGGLFANMLRPGGLAPAGTRPVSGAGTTRPGFAGAGSTNAGSTNAGSAGIQAGVRSGQDEVADVRPDAADAPPGQAEVAEVPAARPVADEPGIAVAVPSAAADPSRTDPRPAAPRGKSRQSGQRKRTDSR